MKNDDFHQPFIKNLVFIGLVTIVSMISARFFVFYYGNALLNTPEYTSIKSQIIKDSRE